jgi:hypothetical protein
MLQDRVITTDQLLHLNSGTHGWLQLGPGILDRLEPLAYHVLVPCCLHWEETILCVAELQLRGETARRVEVLVPVEMYEALPRAFEVLNRIPELAAGMVAKIEEWLTDETTTAGGADDTAG